MTILVADVGGTNARLALARDGTLDSKTIRRYRNREHAAFYDVVMLYLQEMQPDGIERCCVALAGPTTPTKGKLTNHYWEFEAARLNEASGAGQSLLINDLTALGYSLAGLDTTMARHVCGTTARGHGNGQSLVVGMGTGFNVCPVKALPSEGVACLEAEAGHAKLDADLRAWLYERIDPDAAQFSTVEECLAGPGMSRLYGAYSRTGAMEGHEIVAACIEDEVPQAQTFMRFFTRLTGLVCQQLTLQYMPLGGLYLAGSVGRGAMSCGYIEEFEGGLRSGEKFRDIVAEIPVYVIEDDCAPLIGCTEAAKAMGTV